MWYFLNKFKDMQLKNGILKINIELHRSSCVSPFYAEILKAWGMIANNRRYTPETQKEIVHEPLFRNPFIVNGKQSIYFNNFVNAGVLKVKDILYEVIPGLLPTDAI